MARYIYCCVVRCKSNSRTHPELLFFHLPHKPERRLLWLKRIMREDILRDKRNPCSYKLCELHFEKTCLTNPTSLFGRKKLINTAMPTLNIPNPCNPDANKYKVNARWIVLETCQPELISIPPYKELITEHKYSKLGFSVTFTSEYPEFNATQLPSSHMNVYHSGQNIPEKSQQLQGPPVECIDLSTEISSNLTETDPDVTIVLPESRSVKMIDIESQFVSDASSSSLQTDTSILKVQPESSSVQSIDDKQKFLLRDVLPSSLNTDPFVSEQPESNGNTIQSKDAEQEFTITSPNIPQIDTFLSRKHPETSSYSVHSTIEQEIAISDTSPSSSQINPSISGVQLESSSYFVPSTDIEEKISNSNILPNSPRIAQINTSVVQTESSEYFIRLTDIEKEFALRNISTSLIASEISDIKVEDCTIFDQTEEITAEYKDYPNINQEHQTDCYPMEIDIKNECELTLESDETEIIDLDQISESKIEEHILIPPIPAGDSLNTNTKTEIDDHDASSPESVCMTGKCSDFGQGCNKHTNSTPAACTDTYTIGTKHPTSSVEECLDSTTKKKLRYDPTIKIRRSNASTVFLPHIKYDANTKTRKRVFRVDVKPSFNFVD